MFIDVRALRFEENVTTMTSTAIEDSLAPIHTKATYQRVWLTTFQLRLDSLTAQVEAWQKAECSSADLISLKADVGG